MDMATEIILIGASFFIMLLIAVAAVIDRQRKKERAAKEAARAENYKGKLNRYRRKHKAMEKRLEKLNGLANGDRDQIKDLFEGAGVEISGEEVDPVRHGKEWTYAEDRLLAFGYAQGVSVEDLADALGRTIHAVEVRASNKGYAGQNGKNVALQTLKSSNK